MYILSLFAVVAAAFVVMFAAFNVRRAGWSSLVIGVIGACLILLVAVYGPHLATFGDHVLHVQQSVTAAHVAHAAAPPTVHATSTTHATHTTHTTHSTITAGKLMQYVQSKHQTTHQVTVPNTLLPLLQAVSFGLILGILVLVLAIIAITHKRSKLLAEIHASPSPSSAICRECRQPGRMLKQYAWRSSAGDRTGLLCERCAHQIEAIRIVWQ